MVPPVIAVDMVLGSKDLSCPNVVSHNASPLTPNLSHKCRLTAPRAKKNQFAKLKSNLHQKVQINGNHQNFICSSKHDHPHGILCYKKTFNPRKPRTLNLPLSPRNATAVPSEARSFYLLVSRNLWVVDKSDHQVYSRPSNNPGQTRFVLPSHTSHI